MDYSEYIDIPSVKSRFMGNEALFKRFLFQFPDKGMLQDLEEKVSAGDAKEAFASAHTMKGVVANLSLTAVEKSIAPVVEALRAGNLPDDADYQKLKELYEKTMEVILEIQKADVQLFA